MKFFKLFMSRYLICLKLCFDVSFPVLHLQFSAHIRSIEPITSSTKPVMMPTLVTLAARGALSHHTNLRYEAGCPLPSPDLVPMFISSPFSNRPFCPSACYPVALHRLEVKLSFFCVMTSHKIWTISAVPCIVALENMHTMSQEIRCCQRESYVSK